ncbi:MAG: patatin-like phospholipase family protein, partial [Porticoccus sp.]|nr:patatin-like phospholipase family protein [Porticoccus sp.]
MPKNNKSGKKIGLVLSGGGARAAYQVGVLKAVAEALPEDTNNPFPVICGTSAGAINTLAIAGRAGPFKLRIKKLEAIWRQLDANKIYRTDFWGVLKNSLNMFFSLFHSGYAIGKPKALLDNSPLRHLLDNYVRFRHIDEAITSGELEAVSITAVSYSSGKSVTFFQGTEDQKPWERSRRVGIRTNLTIDHLMASSAIPMMFPALQIGDQYY